MAHRSETTHAAATMMAMIAATPVANGDRGNHRQSVHHQKSAGSTEGKEHGRSTVAMTFCTAEGSPVTSVARGPAS
jgi:hypothetical protein